MTSVNDALMDKGWSKWPVDPAVQAWVAQARPSAIDALHDPALRAQWLQCEGTWFVGVDALPNTPTGAVGGSGALAGAAFDAATQLYGRLPLHKAQVSVIFPGYPKPREGENAAGFRYRLNRDAAHVDGLLPVGPNRQRMLKERHAYILGLPLTACTADASPLVIWEGSHEVMRRAFETALADLPEAAWDDIDLTDIYQATRREVFETCPRVVVPASPGEAYLIHRFALHGVAPWTATANAPPEGRMIVYFRPEFDAGTRDWLERP